MAERVLKDEKDHLAEPAEQGCLEAPKHTCALGGALAVISNIHRAIPIIHAGAGCGSNQLLSFRSAAAHQGVGYVSGMITPSSNLSEKEVVFGGEERLRDQIRSTIELIDGDFYVVASGCIPSMIGDDVDAVVRDFSTEAKPILHVNAAGLAGNTFRGYESFFESVIYQLLQSVPKEKGLVNVVGIVPYQDIFWRGNLREIKTLLGKLGLKVNQVVGDFSGLEGLRRLAAAELTIVVSPWVGHGIAQQLKERFDIPYLSFPNIPVGPRESSEFLRKVAKQLKLSKSKLEQLIAEEEREAYEELDVAGDVCTLFSSALPFAIIAGSATALGITRFLTNEAGFTPTLVVINDDPPEVLRTAIVKRLRNLEGGLKPKVVFEVDTYKIRQHLKKTNYRVLLGSSQERYLAQDERAVYVSVTYPANDRLVVRDTYAGYGGGISVIEDIISRFVMPY